MDEIIQKLAEILPGPAHPEDASGDWKIAEKEIGEIPSNYKSFLAHYGVGCIDSFIWTLSPFSKNPHLNMVNRSTDFLFQVREAFEAHSVTSESGLEFGPWVCCAITDNGNCIFSMEKSPGRAFTVILDARSPAASLYETSFPEVLHSLLSKRIVCPLLPDDFPSLRPTFTPFSSSRK